MGAYVCPRVYARPRVRECVRACVRAPASGPARPTSTFASIVSPARFHQHFPPLALFASFSVHSPFSPFSGPPRSLFQHSRPHLTAGAPVASRRAGPRNSSALTNLRVFSPRPNGRKRTAASRRRVTERPVSWPGRFAAEHSVCVRVKCSQQSDHRGLERLQVENARTSSSVRLCACACACVTVPPRLLCACHLHTRVRECRGSVCTAVRVQDFASHQALARPPSGEAFRVGVSVAVKTIGYL